MSTVAKRARRRKVPKVVSVGGGAHGMFHLLDVPGRGLRMLCDTCGAWWRADAPEDVDGLLPVLLGHRRTARAVLGDAGT